MKFFYTFYQNISNHSEVQGESKNGNPPIWTNYTNLCSENQRNSYESLITCPRERKKMMKIRWQPYWEMNMTVFGFCTPKFSM